MDYLFEDHGELSLKICDYLGGKSSEAEAKELLFHLSRHEESKLLYRELSASWALASVPYFLEMEDENLEVIKQRITEAEQKVESRKRFIKRMMTTAAVFLAFVASNMWWYISTQTLKSEDKRMERSYQMRVDEGTMASVVLPDGSEVTLNAGSTLSYKKDFGKKLRSVNLQGEGYFNVAPDAHYPFSIIAGGIKVKVIGTKFDVYAYQGEDVIVSLIEGTVNLTSSRGQELVLHPREQALCSWKTGDVVKREADVGRSIDWINGNLFFDNTSLEEVVRRLEHRFNVRICIDSNRLKELRFTGNFSNIQTVSDILRELDIENQFVWRVKQDRIIISERSVKKQKSKTNYSN